VKPILQTEVRTRQADFLSACRPMPNCAFPSTDDMLNAARRGQNSGRKAGSGAKSGTKTAFERQFLGPFSAFSCPFGGVELRLIIYRLAT